MISHLSLRKDMIHGLLYHLGSAFSDKVTQVKFCFPKNVIGALTNGMNRHGFFKMVRRAFFDPENYSSL